MLIDAHHHLWPDPAAVAWLEAAPLEPLRRPFTPDDARAEFDAADVQGSVVVEAGRCTPVEVTELLGLAARTPWILGVVAWADVRRPDLPAVLRGHRALPGGSKLVGVRSQVQSEPDSTYLDRPEVHRGLRAIAAAGLAFDLVVRPDQLPAAARAAAAVPELRFVLDHLGKPPVAAGVGGLHPWSRHLVDLAAQPNVTCKLSGLVTEASWSSWTLDDLRPFVSAAVDAFGPSRLMFGSDWPVCLLASSYEGVLDALRATLSTASDVGLSEVFAGTAVRTYGLQV